MKVLIVTMRYIKSEDQKNALREKILEQLGQGNVLVLDESCKYEVVDLEGVEVS